jgi:hypothetical protein
VKQEDWNELQAKHPSPEAEIQWEERRKEADERGCRCADSPGGHDSDCYWSGHIMQRHGAGSE